MKTGIINFDAHQYITECGWPMEAIDATARLGVSDADASELTPEQQAELLEFCRRRVAGEC